MNRPLRIMYVYYGTFGLAGAYIHRLAEALSLLDCESVLAVSAYYEFSSGARNVSIMKLFFPLTESVPENPYLKNRLLTKMRLPLRYIEQVFAYLILLVTVIRKDIDVVNISLIDDRFATLLFFLGLKLLRVRIIVTAHDVIPFGMTTLPTLRRYILMHADKIVVHHRHAGQWVRRLTQIPTERLLVHVCPLSDYNSILNQTKYDEYLSKIKQETQGYSRVYLFIGNLRWEKGIDILIDQWIKCMCEEPNALLLIAGNASINIDELIKETDKCTNVKWFLRRLDDEELVAYMDASDIIVTPYREYANSTIYMAAYIHSKRCVLTSNNAMFQSFMDDTRGFMFDLEKVDSLGLALLRLKSLTAEEMSQHAEYGRQKLLASMEQLPSDLSKLYQVPLVQFVRR